MKQLENHIVDTFSDKNLEIDKKFKDKLRRNFMKKSHKKQSVLSRLSWRRSLVIVPVAAAAVVVGGLLFTPVHDNKTAVDDNPFMNSFRPQQASAHELIAKSANIKDQFDPLKYTFITANHSTQYGPAYTEPIEGAMGANINSRTEVYIYSAQNKVEQAAYITFDEKDKIRALEVYDNSDKDLFSDGSVHYYITPRSIDSFFGAQEIAGQKTYIITDSKGNKQSDLALQSRMVDGREVYEFYFKTNTAVMSPLYEDEIIKVVMDAKNYEVLEYTIYSGEVAADKLIVRNLSNTEYQNLNARDALQKMTEAGFDKARATSEFPAGHD